MQSGFEWPRCSISPDCEEKMNTGAHEQTHIRKERGQTERSGEPAFGSVRDTMTGCAGVYSNGEAELQLRGSIGNPNRAGAEQRQRFSARAADTGRSGAWRSRDARIDAWDGQKKSENVVGRGGMEVSRPMVVGIVQRVMKAARRLSSPRMWMVS